MDTVLITFLLYPYPYQSWAFLMGFIILALFGFAAYGLYLLITWKMNTCVKSIFQGMLIIAAVLMIVLFFAELTVSTITEHHVNKQLGFRYATPDTPEGELFIITKVVPGKTMAKSGLKPDDQVQMNDVNELYKQLINNQGKEVVIPVVRNKKKMEVKVRVPKLDVPLAGVSFLF